MRLTGRTTIRNELSAKTRFAADKTLPTPDWISREQRRLISHRSHLPMNLTEEDREMNLIWTLLSPPLARSLSRSLSQVKFITSSKEVWLTRVRIG